MAPTLGETAAGRANYVSQHSVCLFYKPTARKTQTQPEIHQIQLLFLTETVNSLRQLSLLLLNTLKNSKFMKFSTKSGHLAAFRAVDSDWLSYDAGFV